MTQRICSNSRGMRGRGEIITKTFSLNLYKIIFNLTILFYMSLGIVGGASAMFTHAALLPCFWQRRGIICQKQGGYKSWETCFSTAIYAQLLKIIVSILVSYSSSSFFLSLSSLEKKERQDER